MNKEQTIKFASSKGYDFDSKEDFEEFVQNNMIPKLQTELDYDHSTSYLPKDCVLKISPSQFSKFIDKPHQWYREVILKEKGFNYSTASVIGTIVHYLAEKVGKKQNYIKDEIYKYINSFVENDDYCKKTVTNSFESMATTLIQNYVLPNMDNFLEVESKHFAEIGYGYYASGTLDVLHGTKDDCMIVDYKTYNSKTKPKTIPSYYKYQLLVYAFILRKNGYNVNRIQLVYVNRNIDGGVSDKTNKPLKSYPPEVVVLTETITDDDVDFITSLLQLCVETCLATIEYPELTHVLWHDARLQVD